MKNITLVDFPYYKEGNGDLVIMQGNSSSFVPFNISRVFNVRADKNSIRGKHAHKECTQLLVCSSGSVIVYCDDGHHKEKYILDCPNKGIIISPGVWSEQVYIKDNSVLTVLCDHAFKEEEYIRNYDDFKSWILSP